MLENGSTVEVFSFTFTSKELELLLKICDYSKLELYEATGKELDPGSEISPAIIDSAHNQFLKIDEMPIVNLVVAKK